MGVTMGWPADLPSWRQILATVWACWYLAVVAVCILGSVQLVRFHSRPPKAPVCTQKKHRFGRGPPHVTVIRPITGDDVELEACLASTLTLDYPADRLTVFFCLHSRSDSAFEAVERLVREVKTDIEVEILIQDEHDDEDGRQDRLGPNPKIRNMSEAYRRAKGDIVWLVDCNVWLTAGSAGRMVDRLCGFDGGPKHRFVHQMPMVIDLGPGDCAITGGRLEEAFMSSSHAKFYTAINTVLVSPCTVGKSNMFRRSMLDELTDGRGIDYFSHNICEDLLIGDLIWRGRLPSDWRFLEDDAEGDLGGATVKTPAVVRRHSLLFGDPAIQPVAGMSVGDYVSRRTRWLRVRKYGVKLATLVEPGIEPFLCSFYGAWAVTTLDQPGFRIVPASWRGFAIFWIISVFVWSLADYAIYCLLHSASFSKRRTGRVSGPLSLPMPSRAGCRWACKRDLTVDGDVEPVWARSAGEDGVAYFAKPWHGAGRRSFFDWVPAWLGREALALPIWLVAICGGSRVSWRGKRFVVGYNLRVRVEE